MKTFHQPLGIAAFSWVSLVVLLAVAPIYGDQQKPSSSAGLTSIMASPAIAPSHLGAINRVKTLIAQRRYSIALVELHSLESQIKDLLRDSISAALPSPPTGFYRSSNIGELDESTLFLDTYKSRSGNSSIEIRINSPDASIDEYRQMIRNPDSVTQMGNTSILEVGKGVTGIERYSETDQSYERHLLIGQSVIIHITGQSISDKSNLDQFCDQIRFDRIELELASPSKSQK